MSIIFEDAWTISDDHGRRYIETAAGNDDSVCEIYRQDFGTKGKRLSALNDLEFQRNSKVISLAPKMFNILLSIAEGNDEKASSQSVIKEFRKFVYNET